MTLSHKTSENIKKRGAFTISVADVEHLEESDFFGIVSGNKMEDKFERTNMHAVKSTRVDAPIMEEYPITLECKVAKIQNDESPNETAIRELKEETGIDIKENELIKLESSSTIPAVNITGKYTWGENVFVVPEYSFAINVNNRKIILSDEHKTMQWMNYNEAISKLKYDSNKTALWELNERINISK